MLSLRELQQRFAAALFEEAPAAVTPWIRGGEVTPEERLSIYRNNLRTGFHKALVLEFPVLERLVGSAYFRQLAQQYQVQHPSRHGDLHYAGARFPKWLDEQFRASDYAYLPDIARLEWAYQEASVARQGRPYALEQLAHVPAEQHADLRWALQPSARLVSSPYPILRIWSANQSLTESPELIDLGAGPEQVLVHRSPDGVVLRPLPQAEYAFLAALDARIPLGAAAEQALVVDPAFDLGGALRRAFTRELFVSASSPS